MALERTCMIVKCRVPHPVWYNMVLSHPLLIACCDESTELHWIWHSFWIRWLHQWIEQKWSIKTHAVFKNSIRSCSPGSNRRTSKSSLRSKHTDNGLSLPLIACAIKFRISFIVCPNIIWKPLLGSHLLIEPQWQSYMMANIELSCILDSQKLNLVALYHPSDWSNVSHYAQKAQYKACKKPWGCVQPGFLFVFVCWTPHHWKLQ